MGICQAGQCAEECSDGCGCWASSRNPADCGCTCYCTRKNELVIVKGGKKIPLKTFKPKIKPTPQSRYDICTQGLPITGFAQFWDKLLPNKILVPANILGKKVTLSLKNKAVSEIISASGLVLKS